VSGRWVCQSEQAISPALHESTDALFGWRVGSSDMGIAVTQVAVSVFNGIVLV